MPRNSIELRRMLDSDRAKIGKRLKTARVVAGFTQRQAAIAAGIEHTCISMYEKGRASPSLPVFIRLCKAYGTSMDGLVEGLAL